MTDIAKVIDGEVIGIPEGEVLYPLLGTLWASTKMGKTFFASSLPNAVLIDFPPAKLSFGKAEIDQLALTRSVGEGFRSLFSPVRQADKSITWKPKIPGFDYNNQYHFVKTWEEFQTAIQLAECYAEDIASLGNGKVWVVLDDSYRWRALEIIHYITKNKRKWPSQQEFGLITQAMSSQITAIQNFANVMVVHRTAKDFDTGAIVPLIYPTSADFNSDIVIELEHRVTTKGKRQVAIIHCTGHDFPCNNPNYQTEVMDPTPESVLAAAKIPMCLW